MGLAGGIIGLLPEARFIALRQKQAGLGQGHDAAAEARAGALAEAAEEPAQADEPAVEQIDAGSKGLVISCSNELSMQKTILEFEWAVDQNGRPRQYSCKTRARKVPYIMECSFSGKDVTKVDRSAAYAARHAAKNVVAAGLASRCEVQVAYAIGISKPLSVYVDTFGTGTVDDDRLTGAIQEVMDLSPRGIREHLHLNRPIYARTAAYGHFGRAPGLPADVIVNGRVDRLVITPDEVVILDYKTDRPPPEAPKDVDSLYLEQMAAYRALLQGLHPNKRVRAVLLWTLGPRLMALPDSLLDAVLKNA